MAGWQPAKEWALTLQTLWQRQEVRHAGNGFQKKPCTLMAARTDSEFFFPAKPPST
jgi:hypothetical protein